MIPGAYSPGYLVYLLEIFLPGLGLGELLNVWKKEDRVVEKFALALGLGLAFDTLVILVRTSGLHLAGLTLLGLEPATIYFLIAFGLVSLSVSFVRKRRFDLASRPSPSDLAILLLMAIQGLIVLLWLEKYPIFPGFQSPDYALHVGIAQGLLSGSVSSLPYGALYYGIHYQLASAFLLVGGEPLATAETVMAILVALSPSLFYLATTRLLSSVRAGLVATAIYTFSGTIWFNSVFTTGLYANFFGILASLFFVVAYVGVADKISSRHAWTTFILALVMLYYSHFSSITLFPAILAIPLLKLIGKRSDFKRYALPTVVTFLPAAVGFVAFHDFVSSILNLAAGGPAFIVGGTPLSSTLSSIPVLSLMALETSNDVAFVFLLVFVAVYVYKCVVSKQAMLLVPLVWLSAIALVSIFAVLPTRFAFSALLPFGLMAGYGLSAIVPKVATTVKKRRKGATKSWQYLKIFFVLTVLLVPVFVNSWDQFALSDALTSAGDYSNAQRMVYSAMYWLKDNTPARSTYASVTDWRFTYTDLFFGRTTNIVPVFGQKALFLIARQQHDNYLIVTFFITVQPPASTLHAPWDSIHPSANFTLVYSNSDVKIFKLKF